MVAAANLVRHGVPVTVLEANATLSEESRASTFHPPTLDMLDRLGVAKPLIAQGLVAPQFQYRTKRDGLIAQFDFKAIADATAHPFRLQCEQSKLTRILLERLRGEPNFEIVFSSMVRGVTETADGVAVTVERNGRHETEHGRFLIQPQSAFLFVRPVTLKASLLQKGPHHLLKLLERICRRRVQRDAVQNADGKSSSGSEQTHEQGSRRDRFPVTLTAAQGRFLGDR